jgi:uncharacterized repeat protein (TIGR01451 family)
MKQTGKILISLLFTALLLVAIIPSPTAFAAGSIPLTITTSKTTANVGDEITFTISMSNAAETDLAGFGFELSIPAGMTYREGSGKILSSSSTALAGWTLNFDETPKLMVSGYYSSAYYNGSGVDIAEFICTVDEAGSPTVTLANAGFYGGDYAEDIATPITPAIITVNQIITSLNVMLTAPVLHETPQTTVSGSGYTGNVTWSGSPATFAPATVYTAEITVNTNSYYVFSGMFTPTVNTSLVGLVNTSSDTQRVFSVTFPATSAKTDVSGTIQFSGNNYLYDGSPKSLPTATTSDSTGGSFKYKYEGTGTTNDPVSDTPPTNAGTYTVTASYESNFAIGSTTASLTITPITLTVIGVSAASRNYDGHFFSRVCFKVKTHTGFGPCGGYACGNPFHCIRAFRAFVLLPPFRPGPIHPRGFAYPKHHDPSCYYQNHRRSSQNRTSFFP